MRAKALPRPSRVHVLSSAEGSPERCPAKYACEDHRQTVRAEPGDYDPLPCAFLKADCVTGLRKKLIVVTDQKILDLAKRGHADLGERETYDLKHDIENGRGTVWLNLTADQYRRLK